MAKRKSALNRDGTAKVRGRPFTGKDDPRNNLKGAPKRGMSWKEIYDWALSLNAEEIAAILEASGSNDLSRAFRQMPKGVELKALVATRVIAALMFEPDARLLNAVQDRNEGKVTQPVTEMPWREYVKQQGYDPDTLMHEAEEIVSKRFTELGISGGNSGSDREAQIRTADESAADR